MFRSAEAARGAEKYVAAVLRFRAEKLRETRIHDGRLTERAVATDFLAPVAAGECFGVDARD